MEIEIEEISPDERHFARIAEELQVKPAQVAATAALLDEGGTVPFVARYRKERTGNMDEVVITTLRDRLQQLRDLERRRTVVLKSMQVNKHLTPELDERIRAAETMTALEDLYLPYRPKRRTRATIARERGLEPLA
ncbi:MAG: Tex-like N-terminal domain-containing protein, partial [Catalinimonas sp.]